MSIIEEQRESRRKVKSKEAIMVKSEELKKKRCYIHVHGGL